MLTAWLSMPFVIKKVVCLIIENYFKKLLWTMELLLVDLFTQKSIALTLLCFFGKQNETSLYLKTSFYEKEMLYGL
jgi:hypothetical protein